MTISIKKRFRKLPQVIFARIFANIPIIQMKRNTGMSETANPGKNLCKSITFETDHQMKPKKSFFISPFSTYFNSQLSIHALVLVFVFTTQMVN